MFSSLVELLKSRLKSDPNRQMYHYLQRDLSIAKSISIAELHFMASKVSSYINQVIEPGARIVLIFENSPDFLFCFFGTIFSHAIPVCVDPSKRNLTKHLSHYLSDMGTEHVFTSSDMMATLTTCVPVEHRIIFHSIESVFSRCEGKSADIIHQSDDICFIQYTSGSTGKPKGVVVSNKNIIANAEQIKSAFGATHCSVGLSWLPHFHDMGLVGGIIEPLVADFPVYIVSYKSFAQRPSDWLKAIDKYRVTITGGPNIAYEYLTKQNYTDENIDLSCWDVAFIGADFVSNQTIRAFAASMAKFKFKSASIVPCYGLAEATLMVCSDKPGVETITYPHSHFSATKKQSKAEYFIREDAVSCGKINTFTDVIIVNGNKICTEQEPGEICISGNNVVSRYWNHALNFFYPQSSDSCLSARYLRTGDTGVIVDGNLFVIGRSKELLVINGINISPTDIEQDIQETSQYLLPGRGIVYQESNTYLGLVQEVEKNRDWEALSRQIRLTVFNKYGLVLNKIEFVKRGAIAITTSGKIIRSKRCAIRESAIIFRGKNEKRLIYA